ncbi:unnamed protein product, partial [Hapterophycus canaliculatus]
ASHVTDERAYWDVENNEAQKQQQQQREPSASASSRTQKNDEGFLSKLSAVEIGNTCGNLAKNVGDQAKHFGGQAKLLGDQAKGYTLANTTTAAAAMGRFKKQIVAAVDGVPARPDEDSRRESGTINNIELDAASEGLLLLESTEREGGSCSVKDRAREKEEDENEEVEERNKQLTDSEKEPGAGTTSAAAGTSKTGNQLNGDGTVDESGPLLSLGALAAAFKKKPAGGTTIAEAARGGGPLDATSGAMITSDTSAAVAGEAGQRPGANEDAAALKILPRTASLIGGKQWAVMAAVYDTTASIVDEAVGDLFT